MNSLSLTLTILSALLLAYGTRAARDIEVYETNDVGSCCSLQWVDADDETLTKTA